MSGLASPFVDAPPPTKRYCVGFLFDRNEVLLLWKAKPDWQRGKLNGVGGHIEHETPLMAMVREFQEETQVATTPDQWEHFATVTGIHKGADFELWCFRMQVQGADALSRGVRPVGTTAEPVQWVYVNHLPAETLPNLRWLVPMAYYAHRVDWPYLVTERSTLE